MANGGDDSRIGQAAVIETASLMVSDSYWAPKDRVSGRARHRTERANERMHTKNGYLQVVGAPLADTAR